MRNLLTVNAHLTVIAIRLRSVSCVMSTCRSDAGICFEASESAYFPSSIEGY